MLRTNVETYLECDRDYEEADIVLFGAPFDSSTSFRPGTRFGSSAIRHDERLPDHGFRGPGAEFWKYQAGPGRY